MAVTFLCPAGDGQVDFEEFVTLLGPKLTAAGMPDKFNGTDFDSVFWKVDSADCVIIPCFSQFVCLHEGKHPTSGSN